MISHYLAVLSVIPKSYEELLYNYKYYATREGDKQNSLPRTAFGFVDVQRNYWI